MPVIKGTKLLNSVTRFGENSSFLPHLKACGHFRNLHLALGISLNLFWHIFDAIGQIVIDVSGQILTNNLPISAHCCFLNSSMH